MKQIIIQKKTEIIAAIITIATIAILMAMDVHLPFTILLGP